MLKHPEITEKRIDQFVRSYLAPRIYGESAPLKVEFCAEPFCNQKEAAAGKFFTVEPGFGWGPVWRTVWLRASGTIPRSWSGHEVVARLEVGGERTVWKNGVPVQGIDEPHDHY